MTWNVLVTGEIHDDGVAALSEFAAVTPLSEYDDRAALLADVDRFDAILHRPNVELDRELIERAANLRVISKHGVGVDSIDIDAASERGIVVCNTPGANARAVAEHTMALVLAVRKHLLVADADTRRGEWNRSKYIHHQLGGRTHGVFGCGNVGSEVVRMAEGFGMDTLAYDPYLSDDDLPAGTERVGSKADLFERSDVVSLHAPLTDETRHAVGADELALLSESAILVNVGRGELVDEAALVDALDRGAIAGAGLDVFETEPPGSDTPLFDFDTVVVTPHVAGSTHESHRAKGVRAAENVRAVHDGGLPESTLNADAL